jgi:hypothetical protein
MFLREAIGEPFAMLVNATDKIVGNAGVKPRGRLARI